jgi:hypothetical protein
MMVGDQHLDAKPVGSGYAIDARDAVVDGDQQLRCARSRECDEFRRQSIAELEAVRNQVLDRCAERAQPANADGARSRAVGIVVGNDQDPLSALDGIGEPPCRATGVRSSAGEGNPERRLRVLDAADAARLVVRASSGVIWRQSTTGIGPAPVVTSGNALAMPRNASSTVARERAGHGAPAEPLQPARSFGRRARSPRHASFGGAGVLHPRPFVRRPIGVTDPTFRRPARRIVRAALRRAPGRRRAQ